MKEVFSGKLGDTIIIVDNENIARLLTASQKVVYTLNEVALLKGRDPAFLKQIHEIKKLFGGFVVEVRDLKTSL